MRVTSCYGVRRHPISGRTVFHHGVDLALTPGEKAHLFAPFSGRVQLRESTSFGLHNVLTSEDGSMRLLFAHLSEASPSGKVESGDLLARTGASGAAQGVHLHLEMSVWSDGWKRRDPLPFIADDLVNESGCERGGK